MTKEEYINKIICEHWYCLGNWNKGKKWDDKRKLNRWESSEKWRHGQEKKQSNGMLTISLQKTKMMTVLSQEQRF